ncbi:MAG: restriction endonuclease [Firmicutes bacterium]|nr:restriction endonuclease [Bacillota bacterium]
MAVLVPKFDEFIEPGFQAIRALGGSGTIAEIDRMTFEIMALSDEQISEPHTRGNRTKAEYRMAWARNYLKNFGAIESSTRGVWSLTPEGKKLKKVVAVEVVKKARSKFAKQTDEETQDPEVGASICSSEKLSWREQLIDILQSLKPDSFERFCQRLLRESGFIQVNVTGKSGDGGIDGNGIIRVAGFISFPVIFQCKRYRGSVSASQVRDFRGAMVGRAEKGLIITTGSFTKDAQKEATRDGAPVIDLVDGELLIEKIKELNLGVTIRQVEQIEVNKEWFKQSF